MSAGAPASTFAVREMAARDLPQVAELCVQLGYEVSAEEVAVRFERILASATDRAWVAVGDGEQVRGFVHAYRRLALEAPPQLTVQALVVDQTCRGRGVGRSLMRRVEAWCAEQGLSLVGLHAHQRRLEAHRFYESIGYSNFARALAFRKEVRSRPG